MSYYILHLYSLKPIIFFLVMAPFFSSCYTYRVSTRAQAGTEFSKTTNANSYLWGLLQKPQEITTPICDSLNVKGMSVVQIRTNFGYALITVVTLGIWCPMKVEWKCSKPCQVTGTL